MSQKGNVATNFIWKFGERISAQLISTIVSIVLARLLEPTHYGIISMVMIFINLANVFVSDGLGSALIQKKEATKVDFFSVLYFNICFACILYFVLFLCAPAISAFYGEEYVLLTPVLRILGLRIILTAINSVQQAYISKKMIFRKFFVSSLIGTIVSAVIGIFMAYKGYGVWALVTQYLVNTTVNTLVLGIILHKKPQLIFSRNSIKELLPFGIRVLGTGLLITGYQDIQAIIIGKQYSIADLAYYDKGRQFPMLIVGNISTSLAAVLFPKMANDQNEPEKIKQTMRMSIRFSSYCMAPMMLGLAAIAEPFIRLLLTEKWVGCVSLLRLFCIVYLFFPIHSANMQVIKALGKSDLYLKMEIIKKVIEIVVLLITMRYGVSAIVVGMALCATSFTAVNSYPNSKLIGYGFMEQMKDILPRIGMATIMAIFVYGINYIPINDFLKILIQVSGGIMVYVALSILLHNDEWKYIVFFLKGKFRR